MRLIEELVMKVAADGNGAADDDDDCFDFDSFVKGKAHPPPDSIKLSILV